jgi:GNAT superfamily N-acetyltransferase
MNTAASVHYRQATAADAPAMARSRLADPAAGIADPRMTAYLEGTHHPQRALPPRVAYVALHRDEVVGYIAGHLTRRYDCDGEVQYLFVVPPSRRSGIATELLRLLACWFADHEATRICVGVDPGSPAARPFYTRHGATPLNQHWVVWSDIRTLVAEA